MTQEAKVGAFALTGIALLVAVVLHFEGGFFDKGKGYTIYAGFHKVYGIYPDAKVMLSGVPAGKVVGIANDGGGVTVTLKIDEDVKIPVGSSVKIDSAGVMSEKFISILPTIGGGNEYWRDGDYVIGEDETGMETVFVELTKAVQSVQELLGSVNEIVGHPDFKGSVVDMAVNIRDASSHIKGMTAAMEQMAVENRQSFRAMVQNLTAVTAGMQRTMESVEHTMANVDGVLGDPATAENLRLTLQNIADTSARVEHIAANLDTALGDPQTAEDLKTTVKNARELTDKANQMLGEVQEIEVTPSVSELYTGADRDFRTDFDLTVGQKKGAFLNLGLEDIGENNRINAQVGKRQNDFAYRGGVIAGKVGVGVDAYAGDKWKFSAEAYDFNELTLRMRAQYEFAKDTYLLGELHDVTDRKDRKTYFGLKKSF